MTRRTPNRNKIILFGLLVLVLFLWVFLAPNKGLKYYRLNQELESITAEIDNLKQQNEALQEEIDRLKNDRAYQEEVARKEHGFLKKNEIIFDFGKE